MESLLKQYPITSAEGLALMRLAEALLRVPDVQSAWFSRYEEGQRERVFDQLLPRIWRLVEQAAAANISLTIDAEEVERLDLPTSWRTHAMACALPARAQWPGRSTAPWQKKTGRSCP